jgi:hypothetical protein
VSVIPFSKAPSERFDRAAIEADVLRELRYCAGAPGYRFHTGQISRAQDRALECGWLAPHSAQPGMLMITQAGRRIIAQTPMLPIR